MKRSRTLKALLICALAGSFSGDGSAQTPAGPMQQGIKVHGRWTIDVRQPDGTLVSHREFDNAFTGKELLAGLLRRELVVNKWQIGVGGNGGPCYAEILAQAKTCMIIEPPGTSGENYSATLTVVQQTGPVWDPRIVTLKGSAIAERDGTVSVVSTSLGTCQYTSPAGTCTAGNVSTDFSSTTLATPQPVVAGQTIQVTVVFSFS